MTVPERPRSTADRFVGRADELSAIEAACGAALDGRGSLVVVSGEPGVGKSRFCLEAADRAHRAGLTVVGARCWVDGGAPALWPWPGVLGEICGAETAELLAADAGLDTVDPDRFARFAAVTDRLAAACLRSPVCLVIDDVHAADAGTLLLTRFVARSLPRLRLVLMLSRRRGEPGPAGDRIEARLLDELEHEATPIVLHGFDLAEASTLLQAYGVRDPDPGVVLAVHRVTGGNPLFLRRIAALGAPDPHDPDDRLPSGLSVAIDEAVGRLTPATRRILRSSAVLGLAPSVTEAAAVSDASPASVLDAVAEAAAAGLVLRQGTPSRFTGEGTDRFAFGHELVRAALEGGLAASDRLDAHARAAVAVAGDGPAIPPDRLARRAHHALAAAPRSRDDARLAVSACQAAARSMVASFAYEQADALLSAALDLYDPAAPGLGPPPGRLLVDWARAALLCGRLGEARVRFERVAATAADDDDPTILAETALGLGGHWVNEQRAPVERARVLGLQRSALARLSPDPPGAAGVAGVDRYEALRCRLRSRLAAEAVYDGAPVGPVVDALDAARRCGDPTALAEALSLCHHALLAPEHARRRLDLADELVRVGSEAGDGVQSLMGLCWRAVDLFLLADERAPRALEDLRQRADALACQNILYIVEAIDVMLLMRAGRLDEAEAAAHRAYELGTAVGEVDALGYLGGHLLAIRWIQGRDAELLELAEDVAGSSTLVQAEFAFRAAAATVAARAGHRDRARVALDKLAADGLAALPRSSTWLVGIFVVVEAAVALDDGPIARQAYDLLAPFADRPVMASLAVTCLGSTELALGRAVGAFGDVDRAVDHLERAVDANRRLGHRPLVAIAQGELAAALDRRGGDGDRARAAGLLAGAIAEADALGLSGRAAAWRRAERPSEPPPELDGDRDHDHDLDHNHDDDHDRDHDDDEPDPDPHPGAGAGAGAVRADGGAGTRSGVFRRQGRGWLVELDGRRAVVGDLVGMAYLAELLESPGRSIPALTLAGGGPPVVEPGRHEMLDDQARAAYAARLRELSEDLAEAEAHADLGRAERLRVARDELVDELERATGLGGRSRSFVDEAERARTAVRKAIKRAIDEIDAGQPAIGRMLRSAVTTGATCVYDPSPAAPIAWSTDPA
jgi:tetratricopeptide (TPR) repeat protein